MPIARLEFNIEEPFERSEHLLALHGRDWALVCLDVDNQLRHWTKYGHTFKTADEALDAARQSFRDIMDAAGLSLDMIP